MQCSPPNEIHSRGTFNKHRDTYKLTSNGKLSRSNKTVRIMLYRVHVTRAEFELITLVHMYRQNAKYELVLLNYQTSCYSRIQNGHLEYRI